MISDDEQMYDDKGRDESDKYQDKGVEDEEGLRKLVDSGDEEEEDEDKKDDEIEEDDESRLKDDKAKGGSGETLMIFLTKLFSLICVLNWSNFVSLSVSASSYVFIVL